VRPATDYELKIAQVDGAIRTQLLVVDISLGGVGLLLDEITEKHRSVTRSLCTSPPPWAKRSSVKQACDICPRGPASLAFDWS
jgi:hypothetical protein